MTPEELVHAAETKLRDAENNLATCIAAVNDYKNRHGGVPNPEVVQIAAAQATVAQAYANLALTKAGIAMLAQACTPAEADTPATPVTE